MKSYEENIYKAMKEVKTNKRSSKAKIKRVRKLCIYWFRSKDPTWAKQYIKNQRANRPR